MANRELPSPELLRQLLDYNPETGGFIWRERTPETGHTIHNIESWNRRFAGGASSLRPNTHGYLTILIFDRSYQAHRVAWAVHYGAWPDGQVDHINGARADNRITNLRDVPITENRKNAALYRTNRSGYPGVRKHRRKWTVRIGRDTFVGSFATFNEAVEARKAAEKEASYHVNHGRTSNPSGLLPIGKPV